MTVLNLSPDQLTHTQIGKINRLSEEAWPESRLSGKSEAERLSIFQNRNPGKTCHLIIRGDELLGYSESFPRDILINGALTSVMGLATVCVSKAHRGFGYGRALVLSAFERVDAREFPFAMFQTGVPDFYEKLGCEIVEARFINSLNAETPEQNPFWDDCVMIYSKGFAWPGGEIDTLGPGF